ncbi:LPS export ABC transporter permease LptG, partial [Acidocella sp.]
MNLLDRYIGLLALRVFSLVMAALTVLFSLLAFVQQLSLVGQGHYGAGDALIHTVFAAPALVLQLAPVAMLLASLLALGLLARHAELTAWRSLGVSEARIIGALLKLAVPVIFVLFLIAQYVVPTAQLLAQGAQEAALGARATALHSGGFWAAHERQFLEVGDFTAGGMPEDVDIYAFGADGALLDYIHAMRADIAPDGTWRLRDVLVKQVVGGRFITTRAGEMDWPSFVAPAQIRLLRLPPQAMPPVGLFQYIHEMKRNDQQAQNDELIFWSMVAIPVALLAMVLAAAPFAFAAPRLQSAGRQLLIGALLGIGFELTQQLVFYAGLRLGAPPVLTALAPALLLGGVGL